MPERKQRKDPPCNADLDEPEGLILIEPEPVTIASGYSISVKHDENGKPQIYLKRYGDVETKGLRRQIERNYPGASIRSLEEPKPVEVPEDHKRKHGKHHNRRQSKGKNRRK